MTTILLIEDDTLLSEMYELVFRTRGYQVTVCGDGASGVEAAKSGHPDIVLLDMMMPLMNGLEALQELKKMPETASIPVLMLSNLDDEKYVREALKAGAAGYIIKSASDAAKLVASVEQVLAPGKEA